MGLGMAVNLIAVILIAVTVTGCAQICPAITRTLPAEQIQYCAVIRITY
jgi:Tfp pilus assembly protein PilV